jgi:uncharacterized protein
MLGAEVAVKLVIVAALVIGAYAPAFAQAPSPSESVVVARGEAIVKRTPDRAWVTISAESRAKTSREAQRANADVMSAVVARLKTAGLAGDALRTTSIDLQPEFDYANGRQTLRGYVARNSVEARVDDLPKLGDVLDAAVSAGATSIAGVRFDLRERAAAEREALQKAVEDARARANAAASGAGLRVDRVIRIEEHGPVEMPQPRPMVAMRAGAAADAVTPVAPGELEIRAAVTLTAVIR